MVSSCSREDPETLPSISRLVISRTFDTHDVASMFVRSWLQLLLSNSG